MTTFAARNRDLYRPGFAMSQSTLTPEVIGIEQVNRNDAQWNDASKTAPGSAAKIAGKNARKRASFSLQIQKTRKEKLTPLKKHYECDEEEATEDARFATHVKAWVCSVNFFL